MRLIHKLGPVLALAAACSDTASPFAEAPVAGRSEQSAAASTVGDASQQRLPAPSSAPTALATPAAPVPPAQNSVPTEVKLIRTAELSIQVRDVGAALALADSLARREQALLMDSRTRRDADGRQSAEAVLRVPAAHFPALVQALRELGTVQSDAVAADDITKAYADLETRLAVKEQTVGRLRALLENRTARLSDVLEVERELGRAIAELEQMKGERRYYDQQVALSTVRLTLFERVPSQLSQVTRPIGDALQSSMLVLGRSIGTLIYLVVAVTPWLLLALGLAWLIRPLRRRFMARRLASVPPAGS